jgi:hypothetical protein
MTASQETELVSLLLSWKQQIALPELLLGRTNAFASFLEKKSIQLTGMRVNWISELSAFFFFFFFFF